MRMFMVGMCDIFLILYLTTLTQVSDTPGSALTVEDYHELALQKSAVESEHRVSIEEAEQLKRELLEAQQQAAKAMQLAEQRRLSEEESIRKLKQAVEASESKTAAVQKEAQAELELALALIEERSSRAGELEKALEESREAAEQTELERLQLEASLADAEKAQLEQEDKLKQLAALRAQSLERLEELRRREQSAIAALRETKGELEARAEELSAARAEAEQAETQREVFERLMEENRLRAAEAQQSAEQAAKAAELARQAAQRARSAELEALKKAETAAADRNVALAAARSAKEQADSARLFAREQQAKATRARARTEETQRELRAVTLPAESAYLRNVRPKLAGIEVNSKTSGLLGSNTESNQFSAVPIMHGKERLVILALSDLIPEGADASRYRDFEITAGSRAVRKVYLSPFTPRLIGVVLPQTGQGAELVTGPLHSAAVMPTLIAFRGNSRIGFIDNLRDVSTDYFVFKRDQLQPTGNGQLRYSTQGFRGTGDFAEYLIGGDQVVDLKGNLIGIAITDNLIQRPLNLAQWSPLDLSGLSPSERIRRLTR